MAPAATLAELVERAETADELWAVLVRHDDAAIEAHGSEGLATFVVDVTATKAQLADWLLTDELIECDAIAAAGVELLEYCAICEPKVEEP